jgi:transposase
LKILAFLSALWYNFLMENREMQTSNTEEMVTISRAEYEHLQQEKARNAKLEAKFAALEQEQAQVITSLTLQNEWLLEQLKLSKKKLFGRSSEQAEQMVMEQLSLTYNELEAYAFGTKAATEADRCEGARAQTAVRQCAGCRSRGYSHRGGGAPSAGE